MSRKKETQAQYDNNNSNDNIIYIKVCAGKQS